MRNADHWIKGDFDENGLFTGEIRVFNRREKYSFRPNRPPGKTFYGPFSLEVGAPEGERTNSMLSSEEYSNLENKLGSFGGLYVYRDDFRVLPYGRTEADFLEFEKRRSFNAGRYFFSHRKMIGYIDLKRNRNPLLIDKAGREGFIQNRAYREFKEDLVEFFIDIATRYMQTSKEGKFDTFRENQIEEIRSKHAKQLEAAKRKNKRTKTAFLSQLKENEDHLARLHNEIEELSSQLEAEVSQIEINYNSYNNILERLENKKSELRSIKVQKPQGVSVTSRQEAVYSAYQQSYYAADAKMQSCYQLVDKTRERINVENLKLEYKEKYRSHLKYIEKQFSSFQLTSKEAFTRINKLLEEEKESQIEAFQEQSKPHTLVENDSKENISLKISALENLINEQKKLMENSFEGFINHITNLQIDVDDDFLRGWYQEQNEKLNEKLRDYEELAQLGMSIEIIDHQFNVMYSQMNDAVKELAQYKSEDGVLESSVTQLKNAFQHLEVNYKLLRPLYRTSRRSREVITGDQINQYIASFFKNEFERYQIKFGVNEKFKAYEFFTFDSIIKPVFINIINNANYWLIPAEKREIRIELIDDEILIMNSGVRIDDSQLEDIFTLFFTRKKDGRGIGLYLAKKHLNSIGYELRATNEPKYNKLNGACFVISKNNKQ
jgi:signal transduction histidine kinase